MGTLRQIEAKIPAGTVLSGPFKTGAGPSVYSLRPHGVESLGLEIRPRLKRL